jgi:hypothetical protein
LRAATAVGERYGLIYDELRGEPQFEKLVERMKFP